MSGNHETGFVPAESCLNNLHPSVMVDSHPLGSSTDRMGFPTAQPMNFFPNQIPQSLPYFEYNASNSSTAVPAANAYCAPSFSGEFPVPTLMQTVGHPYPVQSPSFFPPQASIPEQEVVDKKPSQELSCLWQDCQEIFTAHRDLAAHLSQQHSSPNHEGQYICLWRDCDGNTIPTTNRHQMQNHLLEHTGQPCFRCDRCQKNFSRGGTLENHMLKHREDDEAAARGEVVVSEKKTPKRKPKPVKKEEPKKESLKKKKKPSDTSRRSPSIELNGDIDVENFDNIDLFSEDMEELDEVTAVDGEGKKLMKRLGWQQKYNALRREYEYSMTEHELMIEELRAARKKIERLRKEKKILMESIADMMNEQEVLHELPLPSVTAIKEEENKTLIA